MPQKVIRFNGINRKINEFQSNGACEELINVRPISTGLEIVRPKKQRFSGVDYDLYTHTFGEYSHLIGVKFEQDFTVYLIEEDGSPIEIDSFQGYGPDYSVAFLGNQILISHNTDLRVYKYQNDRYVKIDAYVPNDLDITYTIGTGYGYSKEVSLDSSDPRSNEFKNATMDNWSAAMAQSSNKNEFFGPILVAFNFSLNDGTEFWTNKWIPINPFAYLPHGENGRKMVYYESGGKKTFTFNSYIVNFTIAQTQMSSSAENMVSHVNVYATRPVFPYDIETMKVDTGVHDRNIYATSLGINDLGITKQLLYFQKSIPISDIDNKAVTFTLDFGETQAGEKVLEVDNGPMRRVGKMVSYNNRAHVYDAYATLIPQTVVCLGNVGDAFYERDAYVYLDCNNDTVVLKTTALVPVYSTTSTSKLSCFYPDVRATKILIAIPGSSNYSTINLVASSRYNYAWGEDSYPGKQVSSSSIHQTSAVVHEANTINVTAQYNPFVFPVEYSYAFGGRIIDVATSYLPISSTQVGQYPLSVFTTSGIFALEQGSGATLYGNITPLQPLVIDGKTASTPYGTFFVSSNGLYLLSGRDVVNVSSILNGERELYLRDLDAYKRLCGNGSGFFYNFLPLLSNEDFEEFIPGATLAYDQLHNELYISSGNENIPYSYVFNLDTKAFHKAARKYAVTQNGVRYAIEIVGKDKRVVDMHTEIKDDVPILLQSRPMPIEAFFTHIQRLILLADARLSNNQYFTISVFGSDNLNDWKCIISSQKMDTTFRQIRTNRAAKSYRDYVVLITGMVNPDTDISDLITDYTVVNRRLG